MAELIRIEVAYATPEGQCLLALKMQAGSRVEQAVVDSGILQRFPDIPWPQAPVGVFGKKVSASTQLKEGDRVEIYRPLRVDPKTRRRERAQG